MKHLRAKDPIIPFEVTDIYGHKISTEDLMGKKWMLSFYRYAECIFCNVRTHQLMRKYDEYTAKGLTIISVWQSPEADLLEYQKKREVPYAVISDPERKLYDEYGIQQHSWVAYYRGLLHFKQKRMAKKLGYPAKPGFGSKTLVPADFLVNEQGVIHHAFYGVHIAHHIPLQTVEDFINS